jgi:uncharacterized MnhB-related membrane protein
MSSLLKYLRVVLLTLMVIFSVYTDNLLTAVVFSAFWGMTFGELATTELKAFKEHKKRLRGQQGQ